jgi:cell division transport system ATP-binding protein
VSLAGEVLGKKETEIKKEALHLLERVGLAIARALLNRPQILLADEPSGNLDQENSLIIIRLLEEINKEEHITMLIVTHSNELIRAFPSRTLNM